MRVVAVMPAYQEATRIEAAVREVLPYVQALLVVDDGSTDETGARAREAGAFVLRHALNRGQGAALKTGTVAALQAGADIVVHIDADGQHDASCIPSLVAPIVEGAADIVFGSRYLGIAAKGIPWTRRLIHFAARLFNVYVLGIPRSIRDPQSGLRAFCAHSGSVFSFSQDGMAHCSEILRSVTRSSLRWREVPVQVRYTAESLQKGQKPSNALRIIWHLFLGFFHS